MHKRIICLMGPTASGKTGLACELVQQFPMEIISVDSAMVYQEMDIGTAKPSKDELATAPHHLINLINPTQSYSAATFCDDATRLCQDIIARGKIPLLVGGTMMYFNALQQGLSVLPKADEHIRECIAKDANERGWGALYQYLKEVDPVVASRIHEHDTQRISRALEIYKITGSSMSSLQQQHKEQSSFDFVNLILFPLQRSWLHERVNLRFSQMLSSGFIEEVQQLIAKWPLHPELPSMRCVGYRQVYEYLQGEYPYDLLQEKGAAATRQLAKRQLTWLRHWDNPMYFDPQPPTFHTEIVAKIREILDNK